MPRPANRRKEPPYSVHAEKLVLAALMCHPDLATDFVRLIPDHEMFFRPEHGRAFDHLTKPGGRGVTTEAEQAELAEVMAGTGSGAGRIRPETVHELAELATSGEAGMAAARVVADKARMRRLIETLSECLFEASHSTGNFESVVAETRRRIGALDAE